MPIFLPYQQLYSPFSIQKQRVVDPLSIKYVKRTSKHLSHGINVVQRRRNSENYFSRLHQNVISIERMLAPSHCLSFFSYIRSLLVSESKARGLFYDADRRRRVVVRMSQRHAFIAYNCSHHALFRLSPPCPSRFCHHSCSWRTPGCPCIFSDRLFICPRRPPVLVDAAGQRTHPVKCRRGNSIACDIRSVCGPDYSNLVYIPGRVL